MTESEAIEAIQFDLKIGGEIHSQVLRNAVDVAIQALEKQIPMKPYHISPVDDNDNANVECQECHATTDYAVNVIKRGHCWKCGQLLDWSDENGSME